MKNYKDNIEILGEKVGMTQVYADGNKLVPVTVVQAGPCPIVQLKADSDKDGYNAVQIGFKDQKEQRVSKGQMGHFKKAEVKPVTVLREFRTKSLEGFNLGEFITVNQFNEGEKVDVLGLTKGRGFQGVVKRWNFSGGNDSHGSMSHRRGGSYGQCQWPGEVQKGKKMPGRMGGTQRTVQNLVIVKVIPEKNLILVKGSFPGANGSLVTIRKAKKTKKAK